LEQCGGDQGGLFDNGYFRSGDLGYLDEDGYLFIVDRKKDIIIRGGENISCQEVEAAIYEHPETNECAVFGLPDERLGEVVGAVIWMKPESQVTADDMSAFLSARLAPYKVPCRIWMSNEALPKLGSEKIDKVSLRNQYRETYAAEVAA
jgi:acyl-CoA synthetase (AMP-forming)/AMP-acid ligase II